MNLSKNLGNFLDYTDFINLLFTRAEEPVRVNSLTNFKEYISAADNLKNNVINAFKERNPSESSVAWVGIFPTPL